VHPNLLGPRKVSGIAAGCVSAMTDSDGALAFGAEPFTSGFTDSLRTG
jgi:hypothetical protein